MLKFSQVLYILLGFFIFNHAYAAELLYPGEQVVVANNAQTLIKFSKGDPKKPLVIFVPGDSHLARISYGFPQGNPKDFLNYWLSKKGYSFLGVSYPTDNPVYTQVYPSFTIQDWSKQIVAVAKKTIQENNLSNHVVVLGWSMGGSIEEAVNVAAKQQGLVVDVFIGLSAVPPLPYVMQSGPYDTNKILPNKLADRKTLFDIMSKFVKEQGAYNQHEIIPEQVYLKQFLGNFPTALSAEGYHYQDGKFVFNIEKTIEDGGVYNFAETPWIALIQDDAASVAKLVLIGPSSWNFIRSEMIYANYLKNKNLESLAPEKWNELMKLINNLPHELTITVHGNHFFFIGEKGAMATADAVDALVARVGEIKRSVFLPEPRPSASDRLIKMKEQS